MSLNLTSSLRFAALFLFLLPAKTGGAQASCNCPEYDKYRAALKNVSPTAEDSAAGRALLLSRDSICKAKGYEWMANIAVTERDYEKTDDLLSRAEVIYKKNNCAEATYRNYYELRASYFFYQASYANTLDYLLKALTIAEKQNDKYEQAFILLNISHTFNRMRQADKGIVYARRALPLIYGLSNKSQQAELFNRASSRFLYHYQDFDSKTSFDTCELLANQSLRAGKESGNKRAEMRAYNLVQGVAFYKQDYERALQLIDSSLNLCDPLADRDMIATNYADKADILNEMGRTKEAIRFADSNLYYQQLLKYPNLISDAWSLIYEVAKKDGNYKRALEAAEAYQEITDSLNKTEKTKAINELEKKYNQSQNEKKIRELAQQKKIYSLLAIAAILGLATLVFFLRQQALKHKQTILETEQRLNRARMNPHFFFNTLAALQGFAMKENSGINMASNLSKFSHIMRETLESTYKEYVTIEQETGFLEEYTELQKIRFPHQFTAHISIDPALDPTATLIPSMILQPFVENCIEHGFAEMDRPGTIAVRFLKKNNALHIEIEDNGKGLAGLSKGNEDHISRASQIIRDRIYLLNIKLKSKAGFTIDNAPSGNGVLVTIDLPLIYENENTADR